MDGALVDRLDEDRIKALIAQRPRWHHTIEFAPGISTPGAYNPGFWLQHMDLPEDLTGKRALDVGPAEGFFTLELHKRGAEVTAVDYRHKSVSGFDLMEKIVEHQFEHHTRNVYDIPELELGTFDIVLFLGVLYHLPDPMRALHILRQACTEVLFLETYVEHFDDRPAARYYPKRTLGNDITNFFAPNPACVQAWLEDAGFTVRSIKAIGDRLIAEAIPDGPVGKLNTAYGVLR